MVTPQTLVSTMFARHPRPAASGANRGGFGRHLVVLVLLTLFACGDNGGNRSQPGVVRYRLTKGSVLVRVPSPLASELPSVDPVGGSFLATPDAPTPPNTILSSDLSRVSFSTPDAEFVGTGGMRVLTFAPYQLDMGIVGALGGTFLDFKGLNILDADAGSPPKLNAVTLCALAPGEPPRFFTCDEIREGTVGGYILVLYAVPK